VLHTIISNTPARLSSSITCDVITATAVTTSSPEGDPSKARQRRGGDSNDDGELSAFAKSLLDTSGPVSASFCQHPVFWTGSTRHESSSSITWSVITRARWEIEASTALAAIPPKTGSSAPLAPVVRSSRCAVRIKHLTIPRIERRKVGQAANSPRVQPWRSIPASRQQTA
jgi:hypothetical protein